MPGPAVVEAASSLIYAAPFVDSKGAKADVINCVLEADCAMEDLHSVRDLLATRLGPEFLQSAATNRDRCVSPKVRPLHPTPFTRESSF